MSTLRLTDCALEYLGLGWAIAPLHYPIDGACSCPKGPACHGAGKHWLTGWRAGTRDVEKIVAALEAEPRANLGLDLLASGIVDVDCDTVPVRDAVAGFAGVVVTPECRTGRGYRLLFRAPAGSRLPNRRLELGAGVTVEVRSAGLSVVPPSRHVSGRDYAWVPGREPHAVPLADLPAPVLDLWSHPCLYETGTSPDQQQETMSEPNSVLRLVRGHGGDGEPLVPMGQRNNWLASQVGRLLRAGVDADEVRRQAFHWNRTRFEASLDADEVLQVIHSIEGREVAARRAGRTMVGLDNMMVSVAFLLDDTPSQLSARSFGLFMRLYLESWRRDGLPEDERACARLVREHLRIVRPVLNEFFPVAYDGRRRNNRQEQQRERYRVIAAQRAEAGQRGGLATAARRQRS
jgi:uncharacterized protein YdaU (DUF1376 family)